MRRILPPLAAALLILAGCSGDDDTGDNSNLPAEAQAEVDYIESGSGVAASIFGSLVGRLPFLVLPGTPGAEGLTFEPDPGPGAPPYAYIFVVPVDVDGDGDAESSLNGSCTLGGDPANYGPGFNGTVQLSGTTPGNIGDFTGTLDFTVIDDGVRLSGGGVLEENLTGHMVTLTVAVEDPLTVRNSAGTSPPTPNLCAYSLDGDIDVTTEGSAGSLAGTWSFASNRATPRLVDAVFTDDDGVETNLPDTDQAIPCGGGTIQDWAGTYDQVWGCVPIESGMALLTITIKNSTTIRISDEDPPGSGNGSTYEAVVLPGSPRVVRGFFLAGPDGFRYREDFTWTLSDNNDIFTQTSRYLYTEGSLEGTGGYCAARAERRAAP
ncbi:MAG: hypothetical protein FD129_1047 [bacterium]|nr:MAG: hypothetical protein FD129_1047 [bacterium]